MTGLRKDEKVRSSRGVSTGGIDGVVPKFPIAERLPTLERLLDVKQVSSDATRRPRLKKLPRLPDNVEESLDSGRQMIKMAVV
jgi:hypothetical protein